MANKNSSAKIKKELETLVRDLLKLLGVKAEVTIETAESLINVKIEGEDLGLLIGYRGENLESLQLFLGIALNKKLGLENWRPVLVDVDGWRAQKEEALRSYVTKEIAKISTEYPSIKLTPMPPAQRRTIHFLVKEYKNLVSESEGEEPDRAVLIRKEGKT